MKARCTMIGRTTNDIHRVAMSIAALTRVLGAGVAVHAARMLQNGRDLPEYLRILRAAILGSKLPNAIAGTEHRESCEDSRADIKSARSSGCPHHVHHYDPNQLSYDLPAAA